MEILYVLQGTLRVTLEDMPWMARPGCAVFVGAATPHTIETQADTRYLVLEFGQALLGEGYFLFRERRLTEPMADLTAPARRDMRRTLDAIVAWVRAEDRGVQAEWRLRSLLFEAAALAAGLPHTAETSGERARLLLSLRRMEDVLAEVSRAPEHPWRVAEAARLAGFEEKSFCRAFHAVTGRTFHRYVNETRVEAAQLLLAEEALSVSDVGMAVGFPEPKTFSRVFRAVAGQTPSAYRRNLNPHSN